jgi:hypothetical protein
MDAGDWVRLKRLQGARQNMRKRNDSSPPPFVDTVNPDPRIEPKTGRRVYTEFGTSKIRRPASMFTDYVASQTADYVLEAPSGECGVAKALTIKKVCTCDTSSAIKHNGLCIRCMYDKIQTNPNNNLREVRVVLTSVGQIINITFRKNTNYSFLNNTGVAVRLTVKIGGITATSGRCIQPGASESDTLPPEFDGLIASVVTGVCDI